MDKSWKVIEREVSKFFGTVRNSLSGKNSKITASDSLHQKLFLEMKYRKSLSLWKLFEKTKALAKKEGKIPVIGLKEHGKHGFLIVIHSEDFQKVCKIYFKDSNIKNSLQTELF